MLMLDTNVVSELMKDKPSEQVQRWFTHQESDDLCISVITIGEIVYGFHMMPEGRKKERLSSWFEVKFLEWIGDRIYPIGESIMRDWAQLKANSRTLPVIDSLLAATAIAAGATLVTRNTKGFEGIAGLSIANPWEPE